MALRENITDILRDKYCSSIDFTIAGLKIDGAGFQEVASHISEGRIAVCGRRRMSTPGRYRFTRDELHVKSDLGEHLDNAKIRSLIVHEAVHALSDIRKVSRMTNIQSESAAFITQTLYQLKYNKGRSRRSSIKLFREALAVVKLLQLHTKTGVSVRSISYAALRKAILEHPNYASMKPNDVAGANGIRRYTRARCRI